jgi:hypothetical protein
MAIVFPTVLLGQNGAAPLTITTPPLQSAVLGQELKLPIAAKGGTSPYTWQLLNSKLPPGLALGANTGVITGQPKARGEYHFTIVVQDSDMPSLRAQREFTLTVNTPASLLTIDWKQPAKVQRDAISGSVEVANKSDDDFDLTVIVLAVNVIGRATTLGYQHFTLPPHQTQVVPFGSSPGGGSYIVHADAIAEVESTNSIYRARKQTAKPLLIEQQ